MIDTDSATWRAIAQWAQKRRLEHIESLARPGTPHDASEALRARIDELDELIRLSDRKASAEPSFPAVDNYGV